MIKNLIVTFLILSLCSCKVGPDYKKPEIAVSNKFYSFKEGVKPFDENPLPDSWWKAFDDKMLNEILIQVALNNHDIKIALANIEQAKALRSSVISDFLPSTNVSASANKFKGSSRNPGFFAGIEQNSFNTALDSNWEIDIFGKIRRDLEATTARVEAVKEQKEAILISILAESAQNYFQIRGLQKRIKIMERNINLLKETENLAKARFEAGISNEFDVLAAKGERQAVQARLPNLKSQINSAIYRISVLAGQSPEYYLEKLEKDQPLDKAPELVSIGLRSDILRRRPDIKEAERNLAAATADIGVAVGAYFPSFSLIGSVGSSTVLFGDLLKKDASNYSISGNIDWSIFNFPAIKANVKAKKAQSQAVLMEYEKTVLQALEDVESSLNNYLNERRTLEKLEEAQKSRKKGFNIAKLLYESGAENFLVILDTERSLVEIQDEVIQSQTNILVNLTQLYKALGGGWKIGDDIDNHNQKVENKVNDKQKDDKNNKAKAKKSSKYKLFQNQQLKNNNS